MTKGLLPGLIVEHNPHERKGIALHGQQFGLALTTHQAVVPALYLDTIALAAPRDMLRERLGGTGRPGAGVAKHEARAIPDRMPGTDPLVSAFGWAIEGAIGSHAHDRHQIGVPAMGV